MITPHTCTSHVLVHHRLEPASYSWPSDTPIARRACTMQAIRSVWVPRAPVIWSMLVVDTTGRNWNASSPGVAAAAASQLKQHLLCVAFGEQLTLTLAQLSMIRIPRFHAIFKDDGPFTLDRLDFLAQLVLWWGLVMNLVHSNVRPSGSTTRTA